MNKEKRKRSGKKVLEIASQHDPIGGTMISSQHHCTFHRQSGNNNQKQKGY